MFIFIIYERKEEAKGRGIAGNNDTDTVTQWRGMRQAGRQACMATAVNVSVQSEDTSHRGN